MKIILLLLLYSLFLAPHAFATANTPGDKENASILEGVLVQVSQLPPAQENAYPDCYYTAILDVDHIVSGRSISRKIILVLPGFFARQYAPEAGYKTGDKVRATVVPFASMPEKVRQTQQADDVEDVDLEFYFPVKVSPIQNFQDFTDAVPFDGQHVKSAERTQSKSPDPKASAARKEQMRHDLMEIEKLLADHGGNWGRWYESIRPFREQYKKAYDAKAQRWEGNSFFSAGNLDDGKIYSDAFVKSIVAFKNYLSERNVDLILVRVPNKGEIVDDVFVPGSGDKTTNPYILRLYKELLEADVEIVTNIIPEAKKNRLKYPLMYWYQDFGELHPAEGIAWVVAEELAKRVSRYDKIRGGSKIGFRKGETTTGTDLSEDSHPFLWPDGNVNFAPRDYVRFTSILNPDGTVVRPKQGKDSPVLVVGSSFIEYPSLRLGGNIPAYLAFLTGVVPDILYRSGSGVGIPRTIAREGDSFLANRSVCIFPIQPWILYDAFSTPPIVELSKSSKTPLASYAGDEMKKHLRLVRGTPDHAFIYSADGSLKVQPLTSDSRLGGKLELLLPHAVSDFPFFMIEIETQLGDAAVVSAKMGGQMDSIYKSYSQQNGKDVLIFKSGKDNVVELTFSNIRKDLPTVIKNLTVVGLTP